METKEPTAFEHVHVCRFCGSTQRRDDVDARAIASGIIECPVCGKSSSLNVQIIAADGSGPDHQTIKAPNSL